MRRKVCLFGTSADPPTGNGGHVGIIRAISELQEFDEIRILPVYRHNYSDKRDRLIEFDDRLAMCRLAFVDIPQVVVSDNERECFAKKAKDKSVQELGALRVGTADLLDMLLEREPETDFTFAMGADTFMDLTNWKWQRSRTVLTHLEGRIVVVLREVSPMDVTERIQHLNRHEGGQARLLLVPGRTDVSSTQIRNCHHVPTLETLLVPAVLHYMQEKKLYAFGKSPSKGLLEEEEEEEEKP